MSWLSKALGADKQTTTTTSTVDPASQKYIDAQRAQAQGASDLALAGPAGPGSSWFTGPQTQTVAQQAAAFYNPYQENVIGAVNQQYDKLGRQASAQTNAMATQAGAFGGSRHGVADGVRQGALDASRMGVIAGLEQSGYQNALTQGTQYAEQQRQLEQQKLQSPLWAQQQAQGFFSGGLGPTGTTSTQVAPGGSFLGAIAGLGQAAAGIYGASKSGQGGYPGGYPGGAPPSGIPMGGGPAGPNVPSYGQTWQTPGASIFQNPYGYGAPQTKGLFGY